MLNALSQQLTIFLFLSTPMWASETTLGKRHMVLFQYDATHLIGGYYFGIHNTSKEERKGKHCLMTPTNYEHVVPGEGIETIEVLKEDFICIEKVFKPGLNLLSLQFSWPYSQTAIELHWRLPQLIDEISFVSNVGLGFKSTGFSHGIPAMLAMGGTTSYDGITANKFPKLEIDLSVDHLPQGRQFLWLIGLAFLTTLMGTLIGILVLSSAQKRGPRSLTS